MLMNSASQSNRRLRALLLSGSALCGVALLGLAGSAQAADTLPVQGGVHLDVIGSGTINTKILSGGVVTASTVAYTTTSPATPIADVTLSAARTLIDWDKFTVATGNTLNFHFVTTSDIVINRETVGAKTINIDSGGAVNGFVGSGTSTVGGNIWFLAPNGVFINGTVTAGGVLGGNNVGVVDLNLLQDAVLTLKGELAVASSLIDVSGAATATGAEIDGSGNILLLASGVLSDGGGLGAATQLVSTGTVGQDTTNVLTSRSLSGASVGGATLNGANLFDTLAGFTNTGVGLSLIHI